jgi:hypothetical protein
MVMILLPLSLLDSLRECYYWTCKSASKAFSTEILESIKKGKCMNLSHPVVKRTPFFSREYFQSEKQYFPPN